MSKIDEHHREREELGLGDGTEGYVFKKDKKKLIKVSAVIWVAKKVDYICEVDADDLENEYYDLGGVQSKGGKNDFTIDEMGWVANVIDERVEDDWDHNQDDEDVEWREIDNWNGNWEVIDD